MTRTTASQAARSRKLPAKCRQAGPCPFPGGLAPTSAPPPEDVSPPPQVTPPPRQPLQCVSTAVGDGTAGGGGGAEDLPAAGGRPIGPALERGTGYCLGTPGGGGGVVWGPGQQRPNQPPTHPHQKNWPQEQNEAPLPWARHLEERRATSSADRTRWAHANPPIVAERAQTGAFTGQQAPAGGPDWRCMRFICTPIATK